MPDGEQGGQRARQGVVAAVPGEGVGHRDHGRGGEPGGRQPQQLGAEPGGAGRCVPLDRRRERVAQVRPGRQPDQQAGQQVVARPA